MHPQAFAFVATVVEALPPRTQVVEFGARNVNGSIRSLFPAVPYVGIDLTPGPDVDIVADAATWTPAVAPDTVICCEVLEHTPQARAIVLNAARILRPAGIVIITCATTGRAPHAALTGGPLPVGEYYANITEAELAAWFEAGDVLAYQLRSDPLAHDLYAWAMVP